MNFVCERRSLKGIEVGIIVALTVGRTLFALDPKWLGDFHFEDPQGNYYSIVPAHEIQFTDSQDLDHKVGVEVRGKIAYFSWKTYSGRDVLRTTSGYNFDHGAANGVSTTWAGVYDTHYASVPLSTLRRLRPKGFSKDEPIGLYDPKHEVTSRANFPTLLMDGSEEIKVGVSCPYGKQTLSIDEYLKDVRPVPALVPVGERATVVAKGKLLPVRVLRRTMEGDEGRTVVAFDDDAANGKVEPFSVAHDQVLAVPDSGSSQLAKNLAEMRRSGTTKAMIADLDGVIEQPIVLPVTNPSRHPWDAVDARIKEGGGQRLIRNFCSLVGSFASHHAY